MNVPAVTLRYPLHSFSVRSILFHSKYNTCACSILYRASPLLTKFICNIYIIYFFIKINRKRCSGEVVCARGIFAENQSKVFIIFNIYIYNILSHHDRIKWNVNMSYMLYSNNNTSTGKYNMMINTAYNIIA